MQKRLNYRQLMKDWMRYYTLPPDRAQALYAAVRARIRGLEDGEKGGKQDGDHMESTD